MDMADGPHLQGRHFIVMLQKYFWQYISFYIPPKNIFFFKMVNVSGIVGHLKFTFLNHFYINVELYRLISLFILICFTYFCLGISEEDALLVKYILCKFCILLRSTGKHM